MVVKPGYKQTEVGVIPEDWEVKTLGEFISLRRGHDLTERDRVRGEVPVMGSAGQNGFHNTALAKGPGVVLGRSGASFGQAHFCEVDFWPHNTALHVTDFHGNDSKFVFYFLKSIDFSRHNSGGAQQSLNRNFIAPILIALPPTLSEQQTIAGALSDVDGLISALDALIAKKRAIKQSAMQELLTGQRRLPGFAGEWAVKMLGEVVDFLDGKRKPIKDSDRAKMQGSYPYYGASGIIDYVNDYIFDDNLILLGEDGENIVSRNSRLVFQIAGKVWVNNHAHVLKPKPETDIAFLTEYLESLDFAQYNTGTAQPKLNQKACSLIPVMLPSPAEQTAIAQLLADLDSELAALAAKRAKTVAVKAGMMQTLLTGQVRLV